MLHLQYCGEGMRLYKVLVGKAEGKRPLGKPRRRWEDSVKMVLKEIGCGLDLSGSG
jgi:hypothetical protein